MTEAAIKRAIFNGLRRIAPESEPEALAPDINVRQALDIDSYDFLSFLIGLHEEIGVDVPESDYGKLRTLQEMMSYLSARLDEASKK